MAKRKRGILSSLVAQQQAEGKETIEYKGDTAEISLPATRIKNEKELIEHCKIDTNEWEIERWVCNKWEVGAKDAASRLQIEPLYQVKAWLRRRVVRIAIAEEIAAILADARRKTPSLPSILKHRQTSEVMVEISDGEPHLGKLAWGQETGHGDYDLSIAVDRVRQSVATLIGRTSHHKPSQILYVLGNDYLHTDSRKNTTTAGTPQDADTRHQKLFRLGWQLAIEQIDIMRQVAPVEVVIVNGNHNEDSIFHLGELLYVKYGENKCPDVTVSNEPTPRKYALWGKVMLMFTHKPGKAMGRASKKMDHPLIMAVERPDYWQASTWREIHTGHLHQTLLEEKYGVRQRILPSVSGIDAWHSENGYVGNQATAEAFVWSKTEGMIAQAVYRAKG